MKDFPAYNRIRGHGGPRTKRKLRQVRDRRLALQRQERLREMQDALLELERRTPTLHDIDWKP